MWGVVVQSLDNGEVIYRRNAERLVMPASNMKLVTASAALVQLGTDFRFRTVVAARGTVEGVPAVLAVLDYAFMGGSMGSVVGEVLTLCAELCARERVPLVIVSASGGARMQEGILSLMQMAKVSSALARLADARVPYVSILTDPTTGGVTASFAMLGDVTLAEPKALIGFAGPRVIEQTIRQTLPEGFQRSEFLEKHGFVDVVVPRGEMKATLANLLRLLAC